VRNDNSSRFVSIFLKAEFESILGECVTLLAISVLPSVSHQGTSKEGMNNLERALSRTCVRTVVFGEDRPLQQQSLVHLVPLSMFSFPSVLVVQESQSPLSLKDVAPPCRKSCWFLVWA